MNIQVMQSPNYEHRETDKKLAVIHWTAGNFAGAMDWFMNPASKVSAHFLISVTGTILQMVDPRYIAWHCNPSNSYLLKNDYGIVNEGLNFCAIGFELEGPPSMLGLSKWQDVQIQSLGELLQSLSSTYSLMITDHSTIDANAQKRDVLKGTGADLFPWVRLLELSGLEDAAKPA